MRIKSLSYLLLCLAAFTVSRAARAADSSVGLSVETGSPDALCPDLGATRRAVRDRIGQLTLDGENRWVARYTIGHAPAGGGDYVALVLKDGRGTVRLERRLPLGGEACDTVVQAIALVLERYFRELQAPASSVDAEPETSRKAPSEAEKPALAAPGPLPPALGPQLQLAAKAGFAFGPKTGVVALELGLWFAQWFAASLEPQLLLPDVVEKVHDVDATERGRAEMLEVPLRGSVGLGRRGARWAFRVGPALRLSLRRASTQGLITKGGDPENGDSSGVGWAFALGGGAAGSWWLLPSFGLTASVVVDAKVTETRFAVRAGATGSQSVLGSPPLQAQLLLGVAFGASP
ncbi:MAG TPA: hypothetical protein VNG33_01435 [Polyangiaceae bacterium]|nr:hypothetical protein [Polyangiaceae bacterium]